MNLEEIRDYCLSKKGVSESCPFGDDVLVFKVSNKMFLLLPLRTEPLQFNAKCDPERAIELREQYSSVLPGYHMNKAHWNTIIADGSVTSALLKQWIDDSYELIVNSLPKRQREALQTH